MPRKTENDRGDLKTATKKVLFYSINYLNSYSLIGIFSGLAQLHGLPKTKAAPSFFSSHLKVAIGHSNVYF